MNNNRDLSERSLSIHQEGMRCKRIIIFNNNINNNMNNFMILYFILFINYCSGRLAPSYITPCPGLKSDCLKKTVQETLPHFSKGIPELDVPPIDPLTKDYLAVTLPGGFKIELNNASMNGLRKCNIDSVSYKNNVADLKMHCNFTIKGIYKAQGRILIVSINGDGNAKVKIKNSFVHAKLKFEEVTRDGIIYYEVKDFDTTFDYGDKVTFVLTNLFKENAQLSEAVLLFLNENWRQISEEFGKPLVDELVGLVINVLKKFFQKVPKDELFAE